MSTRFSLTKDSFRNLAAKRGFKWLGVGVVGTRTKTLWECSKGHRWLTRYDHIKNGSSCPHCSGNTPLTEDCFHHLATKCNFRWVGAKFVNAMTKTTWKCPQGHRWEATYNTIQQGNKCPHCAGLFPKLPQDFYELANQRGFVWLGPVVKDNATKTNWQCSEGHEWDAKYNDIQQGKGCPRCAHRISKPEVQLRESISVIYPDTQGNVKRLLKSTRLELDIYVPSLRRAIEYDGWAHTHYPDVQTRDLRKNRECLEAGIRLLRITDQEYQQDPEAVKKRVLDWLNQP